jgi:hypothetical protein
LKAEIIYIRNGVANVIKIINFEPEELTLPLIQEWLDEAYNFRHTYNSDGKIVVAIESMPIKRSYGVEVKRGVVERIYYEVEASSEEEALEIYDTEGDIVSEDIDYDDAEIYDEFVEELT